jgi:hypothetical protein
MDLKITDPGGGGPGAGAAGRLPSRGLVCVWRRHLSGKHDSNPINTASPEPSESGPSTSKII